MIHKMAWQRGNMTRAFSKTFKWRFAAISEKKKLLWGINRREKDALVVDSADYDMVRTSKFVSLNSWIEEAYPPKGE